MTLNSRKLKVLITLIIIILVILFISNIEKDHETKIGMNYTSDEIGLPKNSIHCYRINLETLPDISEITVRTDKSIFFHETSCRSFDKGKITINARQACAVESTARSNPNYDIYLLYSSPGILKFEGDESDNFIEVLLSYKNVNIKYVDYLRYTKGTPVEQLYNSGKLESSDFVVFHASDVIRFTSLWKYGGIYLDLDVIVMKSLENLPMNFAGVEKNVSVNSAILSFSHNGIGHILADKCLNELKYNFDGKIWARNGPELITKILQKECGAILADDMVGKKCNGFKVNPQETFYPIPGHSWPTLFDEKYVDEIMKMSEDSYTIHLWNDISATTKIPINSNAPYLHIAKKYCPKVVKEVQKYF